MNIQFTKFPSTPYLVNDKISQFYSKPESFIFDRDILDNNVTIEEKIDGANLGISFTSTGDVLTQNRGHLIDEPYLGQWRPLKNWIENRLDTLFDLLGDEYILFGEWCYMKHSIYYTSLPDWFIGFDVFSKAENQFLSVPLRNHMFSKANISIVPYISYGKFAFTDLFNMLENKKSSYSVELCEGFYIRQDSDEWLRKRAKLVRETFKQCIDAHWSKKPFISNKVMYT